MLIRLRTVVAAAMLTVATYAAAQAVGEHPDTYVVRKGDTLWDIAGRFLQKPWLWPEIWQANPQIQNPHQIYPGDVISLAYLDRVGKGTIQPGPRQEAPINAIPLADVEPFLKNLRVVDDFDRLPYVVGLEGGRSRATTGQVAYVVGLENAQPGQRFAVVRPTVKFSLPKHNEDLDAAGNITAGSGNIWKSFIAPSKRREFLGYELAQVNIGTITRSAAGGNSKAATLLLQDSGREVRAGDRIVAVEAQPYDLQFIPHPPSEQALQTELRVLAISDASSSAAARCDRHLRRRPRRHQQRHGVFDLAQGPYRQRPREALALLADRRRFQRPVRLHRRPARRVRLACDGVPHLRQGQLCAGDGKRQADRPGLFRQAS